MRLTGWSVGARLCSVAAMLAATGCAATMPAGDAGCQSYGEARLAMPRAEPLVGDWRAWVADLDDRMTGTCR